MPRRQISLFVLVLLLAAGCAASPRDRVTQGWVAWTTASTEIETAHGVGLITDDQFARAFREGIEPAKAALDMADAYAETHPDGGPKFEGLWAAVKAALTRLAAHRLEQQEATP